MELYEYKDIIDLNKIVLYTPKSTQGGGYSAKIKIGNNDLFIQTPKIKTKNGINLTEKKAYSDLLINMEHLDFINYIKSIEESIKKIIIIKGKDWFKNTPSYEQINERWNEWPKNILNGTGVILHTNIGRAPLSHNAIQAGTRAANGYTDLEIDLSTGKRGSRQSKVQNLLFLTN